MTKFLWSIFWKVFEWVTNLLTYLLTYLVDHGVVMKSFLECLIPSNPLQQNMVKPISIINKSNKSNNFTFSIHDGAMIKPLRTMPWSSLVKWLTKKLSETQFFVCTCLCFVYVFISICWHFVHVFLSDLFLFCTCFCFGLVCIFYMFLFRICFVLCTCFCFGFVCILYMFLFRTYLHFVHVFVSDLFVFCTCFCFRHVCILYMFSFCTCLLLYMFAMSTPWLSVTLSLLDSSDSLKNFLNNGSQNFGHGLSSGIANRLYYGLNFTTINNQLEFLVEQPWISDILKMLQNGSQNFGHGLNQWISNRLYYGLNCTTINNQLKFLVEQPRNSDILNHINHRQ